MKSTFNCSIFITITSVNAFPLIESANIFRIVPSAASAGFVNPINVLKSSTAFFFPKQQLQLAHSHVAN